MPRQIKTITQFRHDYLLENASAEELEQVSTKQSYIEYDTNGNLCLQINYHNDGNSEERYENQYDEKGRLIEEKYFDEDGSLIEHSSYEYDSDGKITLKTKHYTEGDPDVVHYKYNGNKQLIERVTINSDDEIEEKQVYDYSGNQLILEEEYDYDEKLLSSKKYKYDEQGHIVENEVLTPDEEYRVVYTFNEAGQREKILKYDKAGHLTERAVYTEDESGNTVEITEESAYRKNNIKMKYDERGNLTEQEEYNKNDILTTRIQRKYDDENNVVESAVFVDGLGLGLSQNYVIQYIYEYY